MKNKNIIIVSIINFLKGIAFGMTLIVPGVSGATIAVIIGIYEGIVSNLNNLFKGKKQFAAAVLYLAPIAVGAIVGIFGFASLLSYCLEHFSLPANIFFIGLVLGSIPNIIFIIYPQLKKKKGSAGESAENIEKGNTADKKPDFKAWHPLPVLLAFGVIVVTAFLIPSENAVEFSSKEYVLLPATGFLCGAVMIIPGISGALMLKLTGHYEMLINAASFSSFNILILGLFFAGAVFGMLAAAKLIALLIKRAKTVTYLVILGLVAGCIAVIFISGETYASGTGAWGIVIGIILGIGGAALALFFGAREKGAPKVDEGNAGQETPPEDIIENS